MRKNFIKNFIYLTISGLAINLIELLVNAYITKKIGTTVLGTYSLITSLFNFLMTICIFGIPLSITKLTSEFDALKENHKIYNYSKLGIMICLFSSCVISAIVIIFNKNINNIFLHNLLDKKELILLSVSLPFVTLTSCICSYFNALRKVNKSVIFELIMNIVKNIVIVSLIYLHFKTYLSFILGLLIGEASSFLVSYALYKKDVHKYREKQKHFEIFTPLKNIFKISLPIFFTTTIRQMLSTIKHPLIPLSLQLFGFSYEYALSRYGMIHGVALPLVLMPSIFFTNFSQLILPEYSRYYAKGDLVKVQSITKKILKNVLEISLFIAFVLYISSDYICSKLYDNIEIAFYVKILLPIIPITYLDYIIDSMLRGLNLQTNVMRINIIDLIISITLIYFAIPKIGISGYILVIFVSEFINGIMSINTLLDASHVSFKYFKWVIKPLICLLFSFFIASALNFSLTTFLPLILSISAFTICYIIIKKIIL